MRRRRRRHVRDHEGMSDYTEPHWDRAALLLIDLQRDFLDGGAAEVPGTTQILPRAADLATTFRQAGRPIVHVVRLYSPGGGDVDPPRREAVERGARIAAPGTAGAEPAPELLPAPTDLDLELLLSGRTQVVGPAEVVVYKPRWSAFHRTVVEQWLRDSGSDTVVVAGCNLPNCPRATLFDASERDFRAVLVRDAGSQVTEERVADLAAIGVRIHRTGDVRRAVATRT